MIGALLGAATSVGSSIIGGLQAAKQARKAKAEMETERQRTNNLYNNLINQDYTQTAEAQSMLTAAKEQAMDQIRAARGAQAVMGGTEESVAAAQQQANDAYASAVSKIAAQGTARKDAYINAMDSRLSDISKEYVNLYNNRAQQNTLAANEGMKAGMGLVSADAQASLQYGKGLFDNWLKGNGDK